MACSSCGGRSAQPPREEYKVTYPDGRTEIVGSEHEARVKSVMYPGTTFAKV